MIDYDVKPALTPEEWARRLSGPRAELRHMEIAEFGDGTKVGFAPTHEAAALALYDQPFGFTWDDWVTMSAAVRAAERAAPFGQDLADQLRPIRDKIAALLPPRSTG